MVYSVLLGGFFYLEYRIVFDFSDLELQRIENLLIPTLDAIISLILACCAIYLTRILKRQTLNRPNKCLLGWHLVNMFLLTVMLVVAQIIFDILFRKMVGS